MKCAAIFSASYSSWSSLQTCIFKLKSKYCRQSVITVQQFGLATKSKESYKEGSNIEGFTVQQCCDIRELYLKAIHLLHEPTGLQFLHLQRDDVTNVISIIIRTTPFDSTGCPHILEHTTFCGSKKYPIRNAFFKMLNRTLATYMNARTSADYTKFIFSTPNCKDFYNLMDVYMDSVFNPLLRELDFRQEGWRMEHTDVNDPNSPIVIKGVVYNEMKGALSNSQRMFGIHFMNRILPSHAYSFISGGDPLAIPNLSFDKLKAFYNHYYHPSNAKIYSYGNLNLKNQLQLINKTCLERYGIVKEKYSEGTKIPPEKRWSSIKKDHVSGKLDPMATNPEKESTIAVGFLFSDILCADEVFLMDLVSTMLIRGWNSSFYKSFIEPNVGSGYSNNTGYNSSIKDTVFNIGLQGLSPKDFDWMLDTFHNTIDKVIEEGFEETSLNAVLHRNEIIMKNITANYGKGLESIVTPLWNHDGDIMKILRMNDKISRFKQKLANNPRLLQEAIEKHVKNNKHSLILSMTPEEDYEKKIKQMEEDLIKTKVSALTPEMKKNLFEDGVILRNDQEAIQDVNVLPTLKITDLNKEILKDVLKHIKFSEVSVQVCVQPTNGITYLQGVLNTSHLSDEYKSLIPLFTYVATSMGTQVHNYQELDQEIKLKCGAFGINQYFGISSKDYNSYEEGILIESFALDSNVSDMFCLWQEIFKKATFEDSKRLETLIKSYISGIVKKLADKSTKLAMIAAEGLVNPGAAVRETRLGMTHLSKLRNLVQQGKYKELLGSFKTISKETLSKKYLRLCVSLSPENHDRIMTNVGSFVDCIDGEFVKGSTIVQGTSMKPEKNGIIYEMPYPVSYVAKSLPTVTYTHEDYAPLKILGSLLSAKYLMKAIREEHGAYDAQLNLTITGNFTFTTCRDPTPEISLQIFDTCDDWIAKKEFNDQDLEGAKLSVFKSVDAPVAPSSKGLRYFLYGITDEVFEQYRLRLMAVTTEDILKVAKMYLAPDRGVPEGRCIVGPKNEEILKRPGENWIVKQV